MNEWYYSDGGQQKGPVSFDELRQRALSGLLDPARDLVWNTSMDAWRPAGQVAGLFATGADAASNPYAPPLSAELTPLYAAGNGILQTIPAGSQPLDPILCLTRASKLTNRNFLLLVGIGALYILLYFVSSVIMGFVGDGFSFKSFQTVTISTGSSWSSYASHQPAITPLYLLANLVNMTISLFLSMGLTRVALNVVSGEDAQVVQLFGEGKKVLKALGAWLLVLLIVVVGIVLLIVPGIYFALRLGQAVPAIVDKNLGPVESLKYSWNLTRNSALPLLAFWILCAVIAFAACIPCGLGLIYALPLMTLGMTLAYRLLQYGRIAAEDMPGTTTPALRGRMEP